MTKITADTKVTELPFVGGAKENGIHKDVGPLIAEFKAQYRMGIEAWARAGLLVKEIFDADPEIVYEKAPVDASTMQELANATGGIFWRAEDVSGIDRAIARVGAMEPTDIKASTTGNRRSLAPILAGLAAVFLTTFALLGGTRYVRLP